MAEEKREPVRDYGAYCSKYANFFRIGENHFEVVLDFGQAYEGEVPRIHTRIVTGPDYANVLLQLLRECMLCHQKRVEGADRPVDFEA